MASSLLSVHFLLAIRSATAASAITLHLAGAAEPTVVVLLDSSRLADGATTSRRIRAFARREAAAQSRAGGTFLAWAAGERREARAAADAPTIDGLGRVFGAIDAAGAGLVAPFNRPDASVAALQADLAVLRARQGPDFDALYASAQVEGLTRLVALYDDYIRNGDDTMLRGLAVYELPKVRALLAEAKRL